MAQYHLAREGNQLGVFAENEVVSGLATGRFMPNDLMWSEGMADWQPVSTRFQAPARLAASPPMGGQGAAVGAYNPYAAPVANVRPQAASSGFELASLGKRFGAAVIDGIMGAIFVGIPYGFLIFQVEANKPGAGRDLANMDDFSGADIPMWPLAIMGLGFIILAVVNIVMLSTRGQTIGKRLLGIRIVTHPDGQKAGFVKTVLLRAIVNGIIGAIPCVGGIYSLVDICFIFQADRRCLHDQIAGTVVVEGNPPV